MDRWPNCGIFELLDISVIEKQLQKIQDIGFIYLNDQDVVRHQLVRKIINAYENQSAAILKLNNYIDTYLYVVKFLDPKIITYLKETEQAVNFYYTVENNRTGIKITFALIYVIFVTLWIFL